MAEDCLRLGDSFESSISTGPVDLASKLNPRSGVFLPEP